MSNFPALIPSNAVELIGARTFTTSLIVAEVFGKQHFNVLRDIESLDCSPEFHALNFEGMVHDVQIGSGAVRQDRAFKIYRDGFTFLAMGYTGPKAAAFKEAYIARFNTLEAQLQAPAVSPIRPGARFLAMQVQHRWLLTEIEDEAMVLPARDWPKVIQTPDFPKDLLPEVLAAASRRLLDMGKYPLPHGIADSNFIRVKNKCLELLRAAGAQGLTQRELGRKSAAFDGLRPREQSEILTALDQAGLAQLQNLAKAGQRGRPREAWVAVKGVNECD